MNTDIINQYAVLKSQIKAKEKELAEVIEQVKINLDYDNIEAQALEAMLAEKQKTIPTEYGNVTVRETKSYEYPDSWEQETKEYKLRKKELEKTLLKEGRYSVNVSIQLAGKPKQIEDKKPNPKGTIH